MARAAIGAGLLATLLSAVPAAAQIGSRNFTIRLQSFPNRDADELDLDRVPISKAECLDDVPITLLASNIPAEPVLAIWIGDNCNQVRGSIDNNNCVQVADEQLNADTGVQVIATREFTIRPQEILTARYGEQPSPDVLCSDRIGDFTLWFLPVENLDTLDPVDSPGQFNVSFDTQPPNAPSNLVGGAGETQMTVSWDSPGSDVFGYRIYIDRDVTSGSNMGAAGMGGDFDAGPPDQGGLDGGMDPGDGDMDPSDDDLAGPADCRTQHLIPGEPPPDDLPEGVELLKRVESRTTTSVRVTPRLGPNTSVAAVAVAAVDRAGNVGALSEIECLVWEKTYGFPDFLPPNTDTGCRVTGGRAAAGTLLGLALAVLGLVWRARRRHA